MGCLSPPGLYESAIAVATSAPQPLPISSISSLRRAASLPSRPHPSPTPSFSPSPPNRVDLLRRHCPLLFPSPMRFCPSPCPVDDPCLTSPP
ncbi:hypothetical protein M0R45_009044 [Rubus argutus]|uniref:Uncharacterized protein n=1 Tax=Rubus argutus TaxID=59490 RepID=A0AAW1Y3L2_RUBAR